MVALLGQAEAMERKPRTAEDTFHAMIMGNLGAGTKWSRYACR